jgi:hypothetical protein
MAQLPSERVVNDRMLSLQDGAYLEGLTSSFLMGLALYEDVSRDPCCDIAFLRFSQTHMGLY